jgi:hypothetical protein
VNHEVLGWVSASEVRQPGFIGHLGQMSEVLEIYRPDLVIFSGKDVSSSRIMSHMNDFQSKPVQVKIAPEKGETIIGSDSKNLPGELFTLEVNYHLAQVHHLRNKRVFDVLISLIMLPMFPLLLCFAGGRTCLNALFRVLFGRNTWVGYQRTGATAGLPKLASPVFEVAQQFKGTEFELDAVMNYARDYSVIDDIRILISCVFQKGSVS